MAECKTPHPLAADRDHHGDSLDDLRSVRDSQEYGAVDYITKAIAPERFLEALRRATTPNSEEPDIPEEPSLAQATQKGHEWKSEANYTREPPRGVLGLW